MGYLKYKGYTGSVSFDAEDNSFYGKVLGLRRDGILFEGSSADEIRKDFEESIDEYLESCAQRGVAPEQPYSGKLVIRMESDLHGEAAERAASLGISLNEFITRAIKGALAK